MRRGNIGWRDSFTATASLIARSTTTPTSPQGPVLCLNVHSPAAHHRASVQASEAVAWLAEHGDYLYAFAVQRLGAREAAEDMVQETLLAAMSAAERFEGRSSPRTWLTGILQHKIVDSLRRRQSERQARGALAAQTGGEPEHPSRTQAGSERTTQAEEALGRFADSCFRRGKWRQSPSTWKADPQALAEQSEFRAALAKCIDRLPPRPKEALLLVEHQGLSADAASKILGVTATNLGVMTYRARMAMRECLQRTWFDAGKPS